MAGGIMTEAGRQRQDIMSRYLRRLKRIKSEDHGTYRQYKLSLEAYQDWLQDTGLNVEQANALDVEDFLLDLKEQGYAANTIEAKYAAIRAMYTAALEKFDALDTHPCDGVDVPALDLHEPNDDRIRYITEAEKDAMIENIDGSIYLRDHLLIETFWQTGVRKSTLRGILLENVDQEKNRIRVFRQKTQEWDTVYYQDSLNRLLDIWITEERPLLHPQ